MFWVLVFIGRVLSAVVTAAAACEMRTVRQQGGGGWQRVDAVCLGRVLSTLCLHSGTQTTCGSSSHINIGMLALHRAPQAPGW